MKTEDVEKVVGGKTGRESEVKIKETCSCGSVNEDATPIYPGRDKKR